MTTKINLDHLEAAAQVGMNLSGGLGVPHLVKVKPEVLAALIAQIRELTVERDRYMQSLIELGHRVSVLEAERVRARPVVEAAERIRAWQHGERRGCDLDAAIDALVAALPPEIERKETVSP